MLGVEHAVISKDDAPGGMFRLCPIFQRLLSWTEPDALADRGSRAYEWYDHNSLLAEEPEARGLVAQFMDRTFDVPARHEMEAAIAEFAERYGSRMMLAYCRAEYGAVDLWRGRWGAAEAMLEAAIEDFARSRPGMVGGPIAGLAELRRRPGGGGGRRSRDRGRARGREALGVPWRVNRTHYICPSF